MALAALPLAVTAHQMTQVEATLTKVERYAQLTREPAPAFALHDAAGQPVALADFRDKVVVLNFVQARCQDACPTHSTLVARLQSLVAEADGLDRRIQFITIATDTENAHDTAASLTTYGESYGLTPGNWTILHGGAGRERAGIALARAYGLEFVPTGDGAQMHGVVTFVIDPGGAVRARFHGLGFEPVQLVLYAAALAHGEHSAALDAAPRSTRSRLLWSAATALLTMSIYAAWLRRRRPERAGTDTDRRAHT